jgi:hypothetical protein
MATTLTASPPEQQSSSIVRAFRYVLGTRQRRLVREMRQREAWIYQAQHAPTVHDRYVLGTRPRRLVREMRQREAWVYQAQHAPTVHDWMESLAR